MSKPRREAAVVVLWRGDPAAPEVLWVRRHPRMDFLGGMWAFPGGLRSEADADVWETAVRELQEELGLSLRTTDLTPLARWLTPAYTLVSLDATYFLARAPAPWGAPGGPALAPAAAELVAAEWTDPGEALARWERAEALVPEPVWQTLRALSAAAGGLPGAEARSAAAMAADPDALRVEFTPLLRMCPLRTPTLPPATHTNCYVVGDRELVVIEPASPWPDEQARLDRLLDGLAAEGRRVREILLTHHHLDHVGGVEHLRRRLGVPVAAHRASAELLASRLAVDRHVEDGEVIVLDLGAPGERRLRAVFTPGHAPGHLCFLEEVTNSVVAGDMVAGIGFIVVDPPEGDMALYLGSLARLRALGAGALYPAHGLPIGDPAERLDEYAAHRLAREAKVASALGPAGAAVADLLPVVYADTPPLMLPFAARSLLAHLFKLRAEGRAREVAPGRWARAAGELAS